MKCKFCWVTAFGLAVVLVVASCTSTQQFNYLFQQIARFLSISTTAFSANLLHSPGLGHLVVYAALTVALLCASAPSVSNHFRWWFAPLLAGSLGLLMEFAQVFIPSRGASVADMVVNILGIGVGFMVYFMIRVVVRRIPVGAASA